MCIVSEAFSSNSGGIISVVPEPISPLLLGGLLILNVPEAFSSNPGGGPILSIFEPSSNSGGGIIS